MAAARFAIHGKVQGVFFRASAREQALSLDLSGHVTNLPDGSVSVFAQGDPGALAMLEAWLRQGPPLARVEVVYRSEAEADDGLRGFSIG